MNEKKNTELLSKKLIKNSILKYSNITLFERREKKFKSEIKIKKTPKLFKPNKFKPKKIEETKENFLYPFCQTMSSFYSMDKSSTFLPLLEYFENDKSNAKSHRHKKLQINLDGKTEIYNYLNKKNLNNKTANNFYITDATTIKAKNKKNLKDISYIFKKENNKKDDFGIDILLQIQTYRNNENKNNKLKLSSQFDDKNRTYSKPFSLLKSESNKNNFDKTEEENEVKHILDCKISKYNHYKEPKIKDFLEKTQELKVYGYATKIKKERAIRLEEGYFNQIEFYQDTIQSLKSAQKLLDIQFSNKIADYTRFVMSKREREKIKGSKLLQEIINHKKDIEHIKAKINKIELEKSNIIKWIYFFIQMKEKKLVLPNYYKTILEKRKPIKRMSRRQPSKREDKNITRTKNRKNTSRKSITFFQIDNNSTLLDLKDNNKDNDFNNENINIYNNSNYNYSNINKNEELEKIINYKNNLIFQTVEEFQDRLLIFEKENLVLLTYNNDLNHQLFEYKKELNLLLKEENKSKLMDYKIKEKEKELENIKNIIKEKIKLISNFKKNEEHLENEFKKERDKRKIKNKNNNIENNNSNENKNTLLYRKINIIFVTCKIVGSKLKFASNILILLNKKIYTKEKEMTLMLEFIEQTVDYLITKFNYYLHKNEVIQEFIKKVKLDIEKDHKIKKAKIQMMIDLQKIQTLKDKVQKRSNKIYFLPTKKIDLSKFKIQKEKPFKDIDLNKIPTIQDYLYNEK